MNHSWSTPIDKLMLMTGKNWIKYEPKSTQLVLQIHFDQLMIISDNKVLETLNINSKIKGIFKDDILILIDGVNDNKIRKLKFRVMLNAIQCFKCLGKLFPVISHDKISKRSISSRYRSMHDVVKHALTQKDTTTMPEDYVDFVKLCLLDPNFPKVVAETEKILRTEFQN